MKFISFSIFLSFSLLLTLASCKKSNSAKIDTSGSLLDTNIDSTWKAPDGSLLNIKVKTYAGPKDPLYNDTRNAYHADLYLKVLSGTIKTVNIKFTFRHFPQNYSELEVSTGYSYPVDEQAFSTIQGDPATFPILEFYRFIPDPGPIDHMTISL